MTEFNTRQLSEEFVKKLDICLVKKNSNEWIWSFIQEGKSLLEIAKHYNANYDDDECGKSTTSSLFNAFIHFKENKEFDSITAAHLSNRDGILGHHVIKDDSANFVDLIHFTVVDLIQELDGDEFFIWLNKLAIIGNNKLY